MEDCGERHVRQAYAAGARVPPPRRGQDATFPEQSPAGQLPETVR
ncbi:hypothetical protein O7632_07095 [Solwaraspora sp. WMMD406]|nr:hypothetical protein [Solwaraspora sp. WMMD406]MDG4763874.1 hypothetical protein [Solwaraspora sp. WMMD406]